MARQEESVPTGTNLPPPEVAPKSRRNAKRAAILDVAKELFFARGYSGVSMDDVVARVGGSKATLYSHFPSKDELLLALVQEATVGAISEAVDPSPAQDFSTFLRAYGRIGMLWRTSVDVVGLERIAASEALRFPEFGRTCYEQGVLPNRRLAAAKFAEAMDMGILRQSDPLLATDQFMGMCAGWMWRRQIWGITGPPTNEQINANVDAAIEVFMHGYQCKKLPHRKKVTIDARKTQASFGPSPILAEQPTKSRRVLKRETIISAAKQLFFMEGYTNVSLSRVIDRVGGSKATLYSHFPSKQALLLAIVQEVASDALDTRSVSEPPRSFREWLCGFGNVAVGRLMSEDFISLQCLAAGEAMLLPEVGKTFYEAGIAPLFGHSAGYFSDAMDREEIRRVPAELALEQFVEMCTGDKMRQAIWGISPPPSGDEIAQQVNAAVSTFMDGNAAS